jgi:hypothetical protein
MSKIDTIIENDGKEYYEQRLVTESEESISLEKPKFRFPYSTPTKTSESQINIVIVTGEPEKEKLPRTKIISIIIDEAIKYLKEVLDAYDDKVERDSLFKIVEGKITLLWEHRTEANEHFKDVLVFLLIAAKETYANEFTLTQYEAIKEVIEKMRKVNLTSEEAKSCIEILKENEIDLSAPIRNWERYTIQIKDNEIKK